MNFALTDEQILFQESLSRFLEDNNNFEHFRQRMLASPPQRMELWNGLAELGILGVPFKEEFGGYAGDPRSIAVIMKEVGKHLVIEPIMSAVVIPARLLQNATKGPSEALIPKIISGEAVCILAHDSGYSPFAKPRLTATLDGDDIVLNGTVHGVRHGPLATDFLVTANLEGDTILMHLPANATGISTQEFRLMDGAAAAHLKLDNIALPIDTMFSFPFSTHAALNDALEWGIMAQVAEAAGMVEAMNKETFAYLMTREQFGSKIGTFQALQHRAADMHIAAEELFSIANLAIIELDRPPSHMRSKTLSAAKVIADKSSRLVAHESAQMHGGMGVSDELCIAYYLRRTATRRFELGSSDAHRLRFGGAL